MQFVRHYLAERPTVLVVSTADRASTLADSLEESLESFDVVVATTTDAALEALGESTCCVVTTREFGEPSGLAVARAVANRRSAVPVVLRAPAVDEELARATTGPVSAIVLPGDEDDLGSIVRSLATDRLRRYERELKSDALDTLFEGTTERLAIKDDAGRYLKLTAEPLGPDPEAARGYTDLEVHDDHLEFPDRWYDDDRRVLDTGEPIVDRVEQYDDIDVWWRMTKLPWRDESGETRGIVSLARDISDRKQRELDLERQNRRLEQFAGYVSHDLKNPIQIATGYLELAREGDEDAIEEAVQALDRMDDLVEDIELLARGEQADSGSFVRTADLPTLVEEVWRIVERDGATLEMDVPAETRVTASEPSIRPLFENLFKNSLEHGSTRPQSDARTDDAAHRSPDRSIADAHDERDGSSEHRLESDAAPSQPTDEDITIRVGTVDDGFYVEDDGVGIPPSARERIFEQGYTTAPDGTGTGLAIVSDVAESHGWELEVTEGSAGGVRFTARNCPTVTEPSFAAPDGIDRIRLADNDDVGDVAVSGAAEYDSAGDRWTVTGAGADIWRDTNEFQYVYATVAGPVRLQARITDIADGYEYSKAGLMVRDSLDPAATHGYVGRAHDVGTEVLWRSDPGTMTASQQLEAVTDRPDWYRIDRVDELVTCSVSLDGHRWVPVDQRRVALDDPIVVGLAVCSIVSRRSCTATFEDVTVRAERSVE